MTREELTLATVEKALWTSLLLLGRALIGLFLARSAARSRQASYRYAGERYALDTTTRRSSEVGTRLVKVTFSRATRHPLERRGRADLPVDRELRIPTRLRTAPSQAAAPSSSCTCAA